jgi:hypothetical protein
MQQQRMITDGSGMNKASDIARRCRQFRLRSRAVATRHAAFDCLLARRERAVSEAVVSCPGLCRTQIPFRRRALFQSPNRFDQLA